MTTLFTLTVNVPSPAPEKRVQEVSIIEQALQQAAHDVSAARGTKSSGNITAPHAGSAGDPVTIGSWTYTAIAAS
jgi:hypothetical protein